MSEVEAQPKKVHHSTLMAKIRRSIREKNKKDVAEGLFDHELTKDELEIAVKREYAASTGKTFDEDKIRKQLEVNKKLKETKKQEMERVGLNSERKINSTLQTIYSHWIFRKQLENPDFFKDIGSSYADKVSIASKTYKEDPTQFATIEEVIADQEFQDHKKNKSKKEKPMEGEPIKLITSYSSTPVASKPVDGVALLQQNKKNSLRSQVFA